MLTPLIVIVGETASGKSALGLALAERFDGEIICADSWTVYKGFDIGTAKPTLAEQARVPHHVLDVADPAIGFSAVEFKRLADAAIADIIARDKVPFLVGGTGLYVDSVIFDYSFLPPSDAALRDKLNAKSLDELLQQAAELGLNTSSIDVRNKRRVIRLIENMGAQPTRHPLRSDTLVLGMQTERETLERRITARVDVMLDVGLEAEVRELSECYGWDAEPMKGVGYAQWQGYFAGTESLAETRQKIIKASMDLAKRQRTWFKRNNSIQWLANSDKVTQAAAILTTFLDKK